MRRPRLAEPLVSQETLESLVQRAQRGDAAAFAALIGRYERTALAIAYARLGDAEAAGDAVQEALLKAWQSLRTLDEPARFAGWLAQIVRNMATDHQRRRQRQRADAGSVEPASLDTPPAELARQERRAAIDAALAALDEVARQIVTLRYFDNLPSREIAALVGLSPAAVDMRLSRARAELRTILDPSTDAPASGGW